MKPSTLKNILDSLNQGALAISKDGSIIMSNAKAREVLCQSKDDLLDVDIFNLNPNYNVRNWMKIWAELQENDIYEEKSEMMTDNDIIFPVEITCMTAPLEGKPCALYLIKTQFFDNSSDDIIDMIAELSKIASWQWDLIRGNFKCSVNFLQLFHVKGNPKELNGRRMYKMLHEEMVSSDFENFGNHIRTAVDDGGEFSSEFKLKNFPDQTFRYRIHSIYTDENSVLIFGTFQDISDLSKREDSLIRSQFTVDHAREMIFWVDENANVKFANKYVTEKLGYTKLELKKMRVFDFVLDTSEDNWGQIWNDLKVLKHAELKETFVTKLGQEFKVDLDVNHIVYKGKEYHCTYAKDVSEIMQKEQQLTKALQKISRLNKKLEQDKNILLEEISADYNFNNIITQSKNYAKVLHKVAQVADTNSSVLIHGETGTGKELLARAIHNLSSRSTLPIIKVNCATLPENLIESELFGHEKGSFTGADQAKPGKFELADGGTIFLDEIGELPIQVQSKLLRVLQEGEFQRVGGLDTKVVDVRIITATNRNLEDMISEGLFREDLYFRLNVFPIYNIPLRERKEDVPLLVKYFMEKNAKAMNREVTKVPESQLKKLTNYQFPGNVRELENIVARAMIYSTGDNLRLDAVLPDVFDSKTIRKGGKFLTLDEAQKQHIIDALNQTNWKVSGKNSASELLQMNPKTLASRMKKLNITRKNANK